MLRNFILVSLLAHLGSLAATQTVYGASFSSLRWYSLFAVFAFGCLHWVQDRQRILLSETIKLRLLIYLVAWAVTVINADYPLFSGLRYAGHAMILTFSLIFMPCVLRSDDAWKLLIPLKCILGIALALSYFNPVPLTIFDDPDLLRGIFGNPNALGHMSAVGCLLFLHGFVTDQDAYPRWAKLQGALAAFSGFVMLQSGARSSAMAFLCGFFVLYVFYKGRFSKYLMLAAVAVALAVLIAPGLSTQVGDFVFKRADTQSESIAERLTSSRIDAWEQSWDGFKQRPILGWGFGIDRNIDLSDWQGEWSSSGFTGRDPVNDVMYSLESGGLVGLSAYLFMLSLLLKAWFPARVRTPLEFALRQPNLRRLALAYDGYRLYFTLAVSLIALFEFDNTAYAVGNFFAALMWLSMGMALGYFAMVAAALQLPMAEPTAHVANRRTTFAGL
ncbi:MAG: O-antigen ligase family protein [Burkholderiales bacterium]|nr:O-antigen ligase family protein [Burkholderiales bacterium]